MCIIYEEFNYNEINYNEIKLLIVIKLVIMLPKFIRKLLN